MIAPTTPLELGGYLIDFEGTAVAGASTSTGIVQVGPSDLGNATSDDTIGCSLTGKGSSWWAFLVLALAALAFVALRSARRAE